MMIAPIVFLDPNMMVASDLCFAAATVAASRPVGAWWASLVGVTENLVGPMSASHRASSS